MNQRMLCVVPAALLAACQGLPPQAAVPANLQMAVNGTTLDYQAQGQGPPVVLVHGCCADRRAWVPHAGPIARDYRVVTFDQRYWGPAAWADRGEKFSGETQIEDLAAFVRGLGLGPVHLVGWSLSGTAVLGVAVRHPELVKSLFLYEPSVAGVVTEAADLKLMTEDRGAAMGPVVAQLKSGNNSAALRLLMDGVNDRPGTFETLPAAFRAMQLENARTLPLMMTGTAPPVRLGCDQLGQVKAPAAIARGEATRAFYRLTADAAARCIPGARLIVVPGARHLWPAQEPSAFTAALRGFLAAQ